MTGPEATEAPVETTDLLVVGAGLRGLRCTAEAVRVGGRTALLVDRRPRVGGSVRTQRSEGFVCEVGPHCLTAGEFTALAACLQHPPRLVEVAPAAHAGQVLRAGRLERAEVTEPLVSCRGGLEDLLVAFHRELAPHLRLGREVTALEPTADGIRAHLSGERPGELVAARVALATPHDTSASLIAAADPRLHEVASRLRRVPIAYVHLGWWTSELVAPAGHGIHVAEPAQAAGIGEVLWCSNHFPGRSLAGRFLVRVACEGDPACAEDSALEAGALAFLADHAGIRRKPIFRRIHRSSTLVEDSALAELRVRLAEAAQRWHHLILLG